MGLFSSKKTYVSSTVYNMAGAIEDRSNFFKTLMTSRVLGVDTRPLHEQMLSAYTSGPGAKIRNYGTWSKTNYKLVGTAVGNLYARIEVPTDVVAKQIPHDPNMTVSIQRIEAKMADYAFWAEQWMLANEPELIGSDWESDYNETTNEITISFADGGSVAFTPVGFRKSSAYIFAVYNLLTGQENGALVKGGVVDLGSSEPYPSIVGWDRTSSSSTVIPVTLSKITQVTNSYSDGRPDEVTTDNTVSNTQYDYYRAVYEKFDYSGVDNPSASSESLVSKRSIMSLFNDGHRDEQTSTTTRTEDVGGGVTRTVTTTITEDVLVLNKSYRLDTQDVIIQSVSKPKMFIYRLGSGNPFLDKLVQQKSDDSFYLPFIPVRLDNKFLNQTNPAAYEQADKAYKKATGGQLGDLVDSLAKNESLKDIDYAYVMFGVSLNTKEDTGKQYLYRFFDKLRLTQSTDRDDYAIWAAQQAAFEEDVALMNAWRAGQYDPNSQYYGVEPPSNPRNVSAMPTSEIRIRGTGTLATNMDIQISWSSITRTTGTGLGRPGAKKNDYWVSTGATDTFSQDLLVQGIKYLLASQTAGRMTLYHQIDDTHWESLSIIGLTHKNFIYKGKFVETTSKEALADNEESGFLVPLHFGTLKEMSLIDSTQLATACCYMVINSYLVKKTGFFQSTFFKILLVVAVIAITVATGGTGGASIGLLGTNAAVGAAIGLSGTLAIIAGAVANAIVAMVLTKFITIGAVALFGEKFGAIIGAIASVVALQVGTSMAGGGNSLASSLSSMAKADNIIALSSAVGSGVSGYIRAGAQDTINKLNDLNERLDNEAAELSEKYEKEFGYGRAMLDPLSLTNRDEFMIESSATFLERTLMTGSDVANLSLSLLNNFADITLSTELP